MKNQQTKIMNEFTIAQHLKEADPVELPSDPSFFDELHSQIMKSVSQTEIKPKPKSFKPWQFLENPGYLVGLESSEIREQVKLQHVQESK